MSSTAPYLHNDHHAHDVSVQNFSWELLVTSLTCSRSSIPSPEDSSGGSCSLHSVWIREGWGVQ